MSDPRPVRTPLFPPRLLKPLAIAFAVGMVLFLLLWLDQRRDHEFFKPGAAAPATSDGEPLPAPLPADVATGDDNASGLRLPGAGPGALPAATPADQPRLVEPPAAPAPTPAPPPQPAVRTVDAEPVPLTRPPPEYPQEALRRNVGGTVRVQATVGPNGRVDRLEVVQSSGNRHLDRAATEAVRRWTFRPATRDGFPVSAVISVPVSFDPAR